jgi:hypothetical protein
MDYERNKLYFFPVEEKIFEKKKIGLIRIAMIIVGLIVMVSTGAVGGVITGITIVGVGVLLIVLLVNSNKKAKKEVEEFNKNRTVVSDAEIDKVCADHISNLKSKALEKNGMDEDQFKETDPIQFDGYYFDVVAGKHYWHKEGSDGIHRSSNYNAVVFLFSADQVYCYQYRFSLLEDKKQVTTEEYFYTDIVSVATKTDTTTYKWKDKDGKEQSVSISHEDFTLTTSGGTSIGATILERENTQKAINSMKNHVRNKKQQK